MTRREFEYAIHRKLLEFGWRVQRATPAPKGWEANRTYWEPAYLRRLGFRPGTLIDVGVGHGTPQLYAAFPDAFLVLVEPLREFDEDIREILKARHGVHIPATAAAAASERELGGEPRWTERSSFYSRHRLEVTGDAVAARRIPLVTPDSIAAAHAWREPFGLKIDAEGAELEILQGAAATLKKCELAIAEVSVLDRFEGSYTFAGFIAAMDQAGFAPCDLLGIGRAGGSEVSFVDLVFRRKDRVL